MLRLSKTEAILVVSNEDDVLDGRQSDDEDESLVQIRADNSETTRARIIEDGHELAFRWRDGKHDLSVCGHEALHRDPPWQFTIEDFCRELSEMDLSDFQVRFVTVQSSARSPIHHK